MSSGAPAPLGGTQGTMDGRAQRAGVGRGDHGAQAELGRLLGAAIGVGTSDVFVNVVGGGRVEEPGADLAVALAVASAVRGIATDPSPLACFGEVGLTGELRTVAHPDRRAQEAAKFGLRTVVSPAGAGTLRSAIQTALGTAQGRRRAA